MCSHSTHVPPCDCLCHSLSNHKPFGGTKVTSTEALGKYVLSVGKEGLEEKKEGRVEGQDHR